MLDIMPTPMAGSDQKITMQAMKPWIRNRLIIRSHQRKESEGHMISWGRTPIISARI
jgi:hypothetical protein